MTGLVEVLSQESQLTAINSILLAEQATHFTETDVQVQKSSWDNFTYLGTGTVLNAKSFNIGFVIIKSRNGKISLPVLWYRYRISLFN